MQKMNFYKDHSDTEAFEKVNSEEPKEWTSMEFQKGAQEYADEHEESNEEIDWTAKETELEKSINEDFDRTYAEYEKEKPFYKKWWFWLIAALLAAAIIIVVLFRTGHMPGQFVDEPTTAQSVTETKLEGPQVEAVDFILPEGAEVKSGDNGWGVYQYDSLVRRYKGVASNNLGTWYIRDGLVDFSYNGYVIVNGTTYKVNKGKVETSNPVATSSQSSSDSNQTATANSADNGTVTGTTNTSQAQAPQGQEYAGGTEAQQDAMADAVDYINQMAFSRDWLIAQLVSDGHETNDAAWAADHCGADWNEQAYKKAEEYLALTSFSHQDMVDQLLFEGFTADQAEYGAKKAGL